MTSKLVFEDGSVHTMEVPLTEDGRAQGFVRLASPNGDNFDFRFMGVNDQGHAIYKEY